MQFKRHPLTRGCPRAWERRCPEGSSLPSAGTDQAKKEFFRLNFNDSTTIQVLVASVKVVHKRYQMRTDQNGTKNIFSGPFFARGIAQ